MYRIGPKVHEVQIEYGGRWTFENGFLEDSLTQPKYERRKDFVGYPIRGVGVGVCYLENVVGLKIEDIII